MTQQLALAFAANDDYTLERFVSGSNQQVLADITACAQGSGEPFFYLWGQTATGKTHLLQAIASHFHTESELAIYLPLQQAEQFEPSILEGLEQYNLVCLDDLDQVAGEDRWERALFHLFNQLRSHNRRLIVSAQQPPNSLGIQLKDLESRLNWGLTHHLEPLNDQQKHTCLISDAARRGLQMSADTAAYILRHYPRDMSSLRNLLDQLDIASLEEQRRLTIPFIKEKLG